MRWEAAKAIARSERAHFLLDALDLEAATDIPGAQWEPFQLAHLNDDGLLRHESKSRQIGFSWLIAAEAVANGSLTPNTTSLFVSINREESAEKIRYARSVWEALHPDLRPALVGDNAFSLLFSNRSRILSMPQRPVRGKAKAWLYLDEFAHYRLDTEIYTAGLPVTTKGGRIRIGSTPLGARGKFWEIGEERVRTYPGYTRARTPWYAVSYMIAPGMKLREVTRACALLGDAPGATEERVARYGNDRIKDIFDNLPLEDFQQEYEGAYVDEAVSYIPWADIQAHVVLDGDAKHHVCPVTRTVDAAYAALDELGDAVARGVITGPLVYGLDIGRKRDLTELVILERTRQGSHVQRAMFSLAVQSFEVQERLTRAVLDRLPIVRGHIDETGLGMQLAETLYIREGYGERAFPVTFTSPTKSLMATHIKTRFQRRGAARTITIPADRDLMYQIHSIKRRITASNAVTFDVEHSERHHADKFWALALANEAGEVLERMDYYPGADHNILRTTQRLDSLMPVPIAPDLGDAWGTGLTQEQFNRVIEQGLGALYPRLGLGLGGVKVVEEGRPGDPDTDGDIDAFAAQVGGGDE